MIKSQSKTEEKITKSKSRRPGDTDDANTLIFINKRNMGDVDPSSKNKIEKLVSSQYKPTDFIFSKAKNPLDSDLRKSDLKEKRNKDIYWFKNSQKDYLIRRYGEDYVNFGQKRREKTDEIDEETLKSKLKKPADISKVNKRFNIKDKMACFKIPEDKFTTYRKHILGIDAFEKALEGDKVEEKKLEIKKLDLPDFSAANKDSKKINNSKLKQSLDFKIKRGSIRKKKYFNSI